MSRTHKIVPSNPRLSSLLSDVANGHIKIPVFQRKFVWDDDQVMGLLDSIYQGYPVGSLLLWSTRESLQHERDIGGFALPTTHDDFPVNYILDGQQRITTLYGVFNSGSKTKDPDLAARFNVCFSLESQTFMHYSVADPETSINLRTILDTTALLQEFGRFTDEHRAVIASLVEGFKDYEFPIVTIKDRTNQEVCRVFQRINSSGTSLSTVELLAAWTWSDQFDLRNEIQSLLDQMASSGFETVDEMLAMRCLSAIVLNSIEPDALVDVSPDDVTRGMTALKEAVRACVDFLEKELRIKNAIFLPFPIMMVPLVKFFSLELRPDASQLNTLRKWFWFCSFTQRYKAGTNKLVMMDLKNMQRLAERRPAFDAFDPTVDPSLFKKTWRINSTAAKAAICLMAQFGPKTFLSGRNVDLSNTMAAYNAREFHHIYPKAYLADLNIGFHQGNVIANICFLTSSDNKAISDRAPSEYFMTIPDAHKTEVLRSALIPDRAADGSMVFSEFLDIRANILAEAASNLIANGAVTVMGAVVAANPRYGQP